MLLGSTAVCLLLLQEQLEREALCAAFPANYFHARQILQQPPTPNCPHLGHIERVPGPRSRWRARRRGSMLLFFLLLHNVVPGGNWCAPFPGSANDFPDEHRSEGEVRPFLEEGWWAVVETRRAISCRASWTRCQSAFLPRLWEAGLEGPGFPPFIPGTVLSWETWLFSDPETISHAFPCL